MAHWLLKSEPGSYGWADLVRDEATEWDGVRNPTAAANLRAMAVDDEVLIYHSGAQRAAIGIARVTRTAKADGDGRWASVHLEPVRALAAPVTLQAMKSDARLAAMPMLRQPRLSVAPIDDDAWSVILQLAEA